MTTEELRKVDELRQQIDRLDKRIELYKYIKPGISISNEISASDYSLNDYEKCTILDYVEKAYISAVEELKNRTNKVKCMKLKALASYIEGCEK